MVSKKTPHYELPDYQWCDRPDFLTDINEAFAKIDSTMWDLSERGVALSRALNTAQENIANLQNQVRELSASIVKGGI